MPPSCPHGDQPDVSLLRVVLMGEILRADATLLVTLADLLQTSGLLPLAAAEPAAPHRRLPRVLVPLCELARGSRRDAGASHGPERQRAGRVRRTPLPGVQREGS